MKTYRQHRCDRRHQSERTFLQCGIRRLAWVEGAGEYAVVSWCDRVTITLWQSKVTALAALQELDAIRCGGQCQGKHELIRVWIGDT